MSDRARQFLPFDALKGYKEALKEKEKVKVEKIELSEESLEELSMKMNQLKKGMMVNIVYFEDGEYLNLEGLISNIDTIYREITIVKKKISFDAIIKIDSDSIIINNFVD